MKYNDIELRRAADVWLQLSEHAIGTLGNKMNAVFIGAVLFVLDRPVSIRELSKYSFVKSRRNAVRWVKLLIDAGVAKKTEEGIEITELGKQTGRYYFGKLLNIKNISKH